MAAPSNLKRPQNSTSSGLKPIEERPRVRWPMQGSTLQSVPAPAAPRPQVPSERLTPKKLPCKVAAAKPPIFAPSQGRKDALGSRPTTVPVKGRDAALGLKNHRNRDSKGDKDSTAESSNGDSSGPAHSSSDEAEVNGGPADGVPQDERGGVKQSNEKETNVVLGERRKEVRPLASTSTLRPATSTTTTKEISTQDAEKKFFELHMLKRKVELSLESIGRESAAWSGLSEVAKSLDEMATMQIDEAIDSEVARDSHNRRKVRFPDVGEGDMGATQRDHKRRRL